MEIKKLVVGLFLMVGAFILFSIPNEKVDSQTDKFTIEQQLDYQFDSTIIDTYYPYSSLRPLINNTFNIEEELKGKTILIESSTDLYHWHGI